MSKTWSFPVHAMNIRVLFKLELRLSFISCAGRSRQNKQYYFFILTFSAVDCPQGLVKNLNYDLQMLDANILKLIPAKCWQIITKTR